LCRCLIHGVVKTNRESALTGSSMCFNNETTPGDCHATCRSCSPCVPVSLTLHKVGWSFPGGAHRVVCRFNPSTKCQVRDLLHCPVVAPPTRNSLLALQVAGSAGMSANRCTDAASEKMGVQCFAVEPRAPRDARGCVPSHEVEKRRRRIPSISRTGIARHQPRRRQRCHRGAH
jgi:hypothetical protein